jgi:predicted negative regulator of RcsB-dependent stress response
MRFLSPSGRTTLLAVGIASFLIAAVPRVALAHGELLIRIANLTKEINAATNNLPKLYLQRGELYREDQNWVAAAADYDHAQQLDSKLPDVDFCRGKMLAQSGQPEAARKILDSVLSRNPNHPKALIARARVFLQLGKPEPAIADYRHGLELDKVPEPEAFQELAHTLAAQKKPGEALQALDKGINKLGPIILLQTEAIQLELDAGKTDAALARLDTIIQREPRKERWQARRGDILLKAGRYQEARVAYRTALGEIKLLPHHLQNYPPTLELQARINAGLQKAAEPAR